MMPKGLRLSVGTKSRALGSKSSTSTAAISSFLTPGDDPLSSPHAASGLLPLLPISNVSIVISPFQRICSPRHREGKVPLLAGRTNAGSHGVGANLVKLLRGRAPALPLQPSVRRHVLVRLRFSALDGGHCIVWRSHFSDTAVEPVRALATSATKAR